MLQQNCTKIHIQIICINKVCDLFVGVLLHGPPGCGKTLIAKATAKEAGARFINLDVSILTDKWYGESQKLAAAVFSLAVELQPCIIFIDEIGQSEYGLCTFQIIINKLISYILCVTE